jgi:hypothetical protein
MPVESEPAFGGVPNSSFALFVPWLPHQGRLLTAAYHLLLLFNLLSHDFYRFLCSALSAANTHAAGIVRSHRFRLSILTPQSAAASPEHPWLAAVTAYPNRACPESVL